MELLPELKELTCNASVDADNFFDSFAGFVYARRHAGHPVNLTRRCRYDNAASESQHGTQNAILMCRFSIFYHPDYYSTHVPRLPPTTPFRLSRTVKEVTTPDRLHIGRISSI